MILLSTVVHQKVSTSTLLTGTITGTNIGQKYENN